MNTVHNSNSANSTGDNNNLYQFIASPGQSFVAELPRKPAQEFPAFSNVWMMFNSEQLPFFGRPQERDALLSFISHESGYRWWAICGRGGVGKSRLALEICKSLGDDWTGRFVIPSTLSETTATNFVPDANTLLVIDYAASVRGLETILNILRIRFQASNFKLRILLLERSYRNTEWWRRLTQELSLASSAASSSLHDVPIELKPFNSQVRTLMQQICAILSSSGARLEEILSTIPDKEINAATDGGNPLLGLIYADEILNGKGRANDSDSVLRRYISRELEKLQILVQRRGLKYKKALSVLFCTTSAHPFPFIGDDELYYDITTKPFDPTQTSFADALENIEKAEFVRVRDLHPHAREQVNAANANNLEILANAAGVEDVVPYLDVLDEAGISKENSWAFMPDLIGEGFISAILDCMSPALSPIPPAFRLKKEKRVALAGRVALMGENVLRNWSRLDRTAGEEIIRLVTRSERSFRWLLYFVAALNGLREDRFSFDLPAAIAHHVKDSREDVARFRTIRDFVMSGEGDLGEADVLVPQIAWICHRIAFLDTLQFFQQARLLGLIVSVIESSPAQRPIDLSRLLDCLESILEFFNRGPHEELASCGNAIHDAIFRAMELMCTRVAHEFPPAEDSNTQHIYDRFIAVSVHCSYGVLRGFYGSGTTEKTRSLATALLLYAQEIRRVSLNKHGRFVIERNILALGVDRMRSSALCDGYEELLDTDDLKSSPTRYTEIAGDYLVVMATKSALNGFTRATDFVGNAFSAGLVQTAKLLSVWKGLCADIARGLIGSPELHGPCARGMFRLASAPDCDDGFDAYFQTVLGLSYSSGSQSHALATKMVETAFEQPNADWSEQHIATAVHIVGNAHVTSRQAISPSNINFEVQEAAGEFSSNFAARFPRSVNLLRIKKVTATFKHLDGSYRAEFYAPLPSTHSRLSADEILEMSRMQHELSLEGVKFRWSEQS